MAALDFIASDIGHGSLGLRDNLRPFTELVLESAGQKHVFVELRGSKLKNDGWMPLANQPGIWTNAISEVFDGIVRHVVGVRVLGAILSQMENQSGVVNTPGSYSYDGVTLIVQLPGAADPRTTDVLVQFGFHYSNVGVELPLLDRDRLLDGGIEAWTTPQDATFYSESFIGGANPGTLNRDSVIVAPDGGIYSCRFDDSLSAGTGNRLHQAISFTSAGPHSFSGWYRTPANIAAGVTARIAVQDAATRWLQRDGRNWSVSETWLDLTPTGGEWRRYVFHHLMPSEGVSTAHVGIFNSSGGAVTERVWFDGLRFSRISRWVYYEPAIPFESMPSREIQRADRFYGRSSVGLGGLTILNTNGRMEALLGSYDFTQQEALVREGGRFAKGGNEILAEDQWTAIFAYMSKPRVDDRSAQVDLEDVHAIWNSPLPQNTYPPYPNLATIDEGRLRPYVFGFVPHARPATVDKISGLGQFEIADPLTGSHPNGSPLLVVPTASAVYEDFQAGEEADATRAVAPVAAEYTFEAPTGQIHFILPPGPVRITDGENDRLNFVSNSVTRVANLTPGLYRIRGSAPSLALHIQDQMRAATGAADVDVTYSSVTALLTISYTGAGNFQLLASTGVDKGRSILPTAGFIQSTPDYTGAVTYTATQAVLAAGRSFRADLSGYIDDTLGTYTGTASIMIRKAADVLVFILRVIFGIPVDRLDLPSFVAARTSAPQILAMYLGSLGNDGGEKEFGDVVQALEQGGALDLILDGEVFRLRTRDDTVPAGVLDLYDRDFLSFRAWYDAQDVFDLVRVSYSQDPSTGAWNTSERGSPQAELRYFRNDPKVFKTYLSSADDALARREALYAEVTTAPIRYAFEVKGSCLRKMVGDKVRLNRINMLGGSGKLVRIVRKRDDLQTWVSSIEAVEVIPAAAARTATPDPVVWPPPTGTFDGAWDMGA